MIFKTYDMEHTAQFLAMRNARVFVRSRYRNHPAIRFRPRMLTSPYWIVRQRVNEMAKWSAAGGICVAQVGVTWRDLPEHEAQLLCECPFSVKQLERRCKRTTGKVVVYYPPTWELHVWSLLRFAKPEKLRRALLALRHMIVVLDKAPIFTPRVFRHA